MERLTDTGKKGEARFRELDTPIATPEQRHAKVGFQCLDLPADGAVREVQLPGGSVKLRRSAAISKAGSVLSGGRRRTRVPHVNNLHTTVTKNRLSVH
jgi:hypothetical protein